MEHDHGRVVVQLLQVLAEDSLAACALRPGDCRLRLRAQRQIQPAKPFPQAVTGHLLTLLVQPLVPTPSRRASGATVEFARGDGYILRRPRFGHRRGLASTREAGDGLRLCVPVGDRAGRECGAARDTGIRAPELQ